MPRGYSQHNQGGWKHRKSSIDKMKINSTGLTSNEKNGRWKGLNVSYGALHTWIREHFGAPTTCEKCGKCNLTGQKIHWANKSQNYSRDRKDWIRLCAKCHKKFDKGKLALKYHERREIKKEKLKCKKLIDIFVRDVCRGLHPPKSKVRSLVIELINNLKKDSPKC